MVLEESFRLRFPSQDAAERFGTDDETYEGLDEEVEKRSSSEDTMPGLFEKKKRDRVSTARDDSRPASSKNQIAN